MTEPIHDKHLQARYAMADRLAYFLYSNHMGSDWMKHAGDRLWITVCHQSGEKVKRVGGKDVGPSLETRELTLSKLQDLEASGAKRGPSLAEIEDARDKSSWLAPASSTTSDGPSVSPGQQDTTTGLPASVPGPSDSSEAPATESSAGSSLLRSPERQPGPKLPVSATASEDVCPPAGIGLSESPRGGQASLLPYLPFQPHSVESRDAAHKNRHSERSDRLRVLQILRDRGPLTDEQIADALGKTLNTARPRRRGLVKDNLVARVGTGKTALGHDCALWGIAEAVAS